MVPLQLSRPCHRPVLVLGLSHFYPSYSNAPSIIIDTVVLSVLISGMTREHPLSFSAPARRGGPTHWRRAIPRVPTSRKGCPQYPKPARPAAILSARIAPGINPPAKRRPARLISSIQVRSFVRVPSLKSSRINTSANPAFFIKSLILHDLKSIRINKRACKYPRIKTSEMYSCKSSRINTSKKYPGEGVGRLDTTAPAD